MKASHIQKMMAVLVVLNVATVADALAYSPGDRVECNGSNVNVRNASCTVIGQVSGPTRGTVLSGSVSCTGCGASWTNVNWDTGVTGYTCGDFLILAPPFPPTLVGPGSGSSPGPTISGSSQTFQWNSSGGATNYGLYVRDLTTDTLVYNNPTVGNVTSKVVSGLAAGHQFRWNMQASNSAGYSTYSGYFYFQTQAACPAPTAITNNASPVGNTSATLNGIVTPNGCTTTVYFEYGLTTSYGTATANQSFTGTNSQLVNANISGLSPNTTYHFRLRASNSGGSNSGGDMMFTTSGQGPSVTTTAATNVTSTGATLNGTVNPNGSSTTAHFEFGLTTNYGASTSNTSVGSGNSAVSVQAPTGPIQPGQTFHYRLVATNGGGTINGNDVMFTTPPNGTPTPTPISTATPTPNPTATPNPTPTPSVTPSSGPIITAVTRQYPGVFLQGANVTNVFDVHVIWNGQPGSVNFKVNGATIATEQGNLGGASHSFNMGSFAASFAPIEMRITAQNAAQQSSPTNIQNICVLPYPAWLSEESAAGNIVHYLINSGDVKATFTADFPRPHLASGGPINIPSSIPFIGGQLGVIESFARLQGSVSSNDRTGLITLSGQTGFTAAGQAVSGRVSGTGNISLECENGLQLQSTTFQLGLAGSLRKEAGIADVIPELRLLEAEPIIGGLIRWFNNRATLSGEIEPSLDFTALFKQDGTGHLKFDSTSGTLALALNATLQVNGGNDRLSARAWVGGRGSSTLLVPGDTFVQNLNVAFEAGVALRLDYIFVSLDWERRVDYACSWTPGSGVACGRTQAESEAKGSNSVSVITPDYTRFGPYAEFLPAAGKPSNQPLPTHQQLSAATTTASTTLIGNLFAGASPTTIELANGRQLLLWVHADASLPITQATGIMWSMRGTQGEWTEPQLIESDTRAEFSPVAGVDTSGKVVAAWLRVKEGDFPASINASSDVERFYKDFEVVQASFDPDRLSWSEVTQITDDLAFDTDLKLSSDGSGGLLLSWLSSFGPELMSNEATPSTLKYCLRDGNQWSSPMALVDSLVGVSKHAAAVRGNEMVIIVPRSQNGTTNGGVLDAYRGSSGVWGTGATFAAGNVENRLPSVCFDSKGAVHVIWLRENDLMSATLDDPTPRLVRSASTGVGFYDARLVANRAGNLALIYEQVGETGAGTLFGSVYFPATNTWGEGQQLIAETQQSRDASAYFDSDGHLRVAYLSTEILRTSRTVIIGGVQTIIENLPEEGQTSLKTATVSGLSLFAPSALANISTRLNVGADDNVLIGGFIITGTQPKRVMVRGVGPSLARFGLANVLPDPALELHDSTKVIAANDNWDDSSNRQEIIDSTLAPIDPQESAILVVLTPGVYTAVVRDINKSPGVGLVEVYDLDQTVDSKLANISTRGFVGTGNNVMIGGTIVKGSNPSTALFRAIGPSLANFGVPDALENPTLELHDSQGNIMGVNDNWRDTQEAAIQATGIAPTDNRESAILAILPPGAYTAIVRGSGDSTGVALVEAYQLQ